MAKTRFNFTRLLFPATAVLFAVPVLAGTLDLLLPKPVKAELLEGTVPAELCTKVETVRGAVPGAPDAVAAEAYALDVSGSGVRITASDKRGERHARTTLAQLTKLGGGTVPCCRIVDWPAFRWRGFMNDCGRNYLEMEGVKAILDVMALYKMNLFHWHLTDYHGWRLESKKYPCLQRPESFLRQKGK